MWKQINPPYEKILILIVAVSLLFSCNNDDDKNGNDAPCIVSGTMQLETRAQVDAFAGSNYCTVSGNFTMGSYYQQSDITDII